MGGLISRLKKLWVFTVFADEFGVSDVQANYTRLYAWMANQLGHMTLGLGTAFFFAWIVETFDWVAVTEGKNAWAFVVIAIFILLTAAPVFLALRAPPPDSFIGAQHPNYGYRPFTGAARKLWVIGLLALLAALALTIFLTVGSPDTIFYRYLGVGAAALAFVAAMTMLAKDLDYLIFGVVTLGSGVWVAVDGFGATGVALTIATLLIAAAFVASVYFARGGGPSAAPAVIAFFAAAAYVAYVLHFREHDAWRISVGAMLASVAVWWVKEFSSDIPGVARELWETADKRRKAGAAADAPDVQREYFLDARWDARTDGAFYLAGALIAAGVLSPVFARHMGDVAPMTEAIDGIWLSGGEVMGLFIFAAIFIGVGERWAYRQQALDRMDAPFASRLAVFQSRATIWRLTGDNGPEEITLPGAHVLDLLQDFARDHGGRMAAYNMLFVVGAADAGKSPLGVAIASEAALADIPRGIHTSVVPMLATAATKLKPRAEQRRSLVTTARRAILEAQRIRARPKSSVSKIGSGPNVDEEQIADLVVIDDFDPITLSGRRANASRFPECKTQLQLLIKKLELERPARDGRPRRFVFLVEDIDIRPEDADWTPDGPAMRNLLGSVEEALHASGERGLAVDFRNRSAVVALIGEPIEE